jgi:hypothetical protein
LKENIKQFDGIEGLIERKDKYPVYVSESLFKLTKEMTASYKK